MSKPKATMIPAAYFCTDEVPDRFKDVYASTLYESFTLEEALGADSDSLPDLVLIADITSVLDTSVKHIFVIYNPDPKHLAMSDFGDPLTIKVLVNSLSKKKLLAKYWDRCHAVHHLNESIGTFDSKLVINELKSKNLPSSSPLLSSFCTTLEETQRQLLTVNQEILKEFLVDFSFT